MAQNHPNHRQRKVLVTLGVVEEGNHVGVSVVADFVEKIGDVLVRHELPCQKFSKVSAQVHYLGKIQPRQCV